MKAQPTPEQLAGVQPQAHVPSPPADMYWRDLAGRLASAADSSADVNVQLVGMLRAQVAEMQRVIAGMQQQRRVPSPDAVKAVTAGLPQSEIDRITDALRQDDPSKALRRVADSPAVAASSPAPADEAPTRVPPDVECSLAGCDYFAKGDGRAARVKVAALTHFVNSVFRWLESIIHLADITMPDIKPAAPRAVRAMGFLKTFVERSMSRPHTVLFTRSFVADCLIDLFGYIVPPVTGEQSVDKIRSVRWDAAVALAQDSDVEHRVLVNLFARVFERRDIRVMLGAVFCECIGPEKREGVAKDIVAFAQAIADYEGEHDVTVKSLAAWLEGLATEFARQD